MEKEPAFDALNLNQVHLAAYLLIYCVIHGVYGTQWHGGILFNS